MRKHPLLLVVAALLLLITIHAANAITYTDNVVTSATSQSVSNPSGYYLKVNESCTLASVTKHPSSTPTRALLYNEAHNVLLENVSWGSNTANFTTVLNASTNYLILVSSSGASYTNYYTANASFFPHLFTGRNTIWSINASLQADNGPFSTFGTTYTQSFTSFNCTQASAPGAPILTVTVSDLVNSSLVAGFCINATGTNTSQYLCNATGTMLSFNTTGTYNITAFNITGGHASATYFNFSVANYPFTTTHTLQINTSQARLNMSVYKIFFNTSIANFNATNGGATNTTSTNTLTIAARNGTNNLKIDVAGNYSINYTCTVTSVLTTTTCEARDVYDTILTLNASNLSTTVFNFNVNITNTTLGLNNQQNTTSGPGIVYRLLQGYTYYTYFTKSGLSDANQTFTILNNSVGYTFTVVPSPAVNFSFYDELTNDLITTENLTLEVINPNFAQNYSVIGGLRYLNLTGLIGNTIFRYYGPTYAQRDYILEMQAGAVYQLRLYDINLSLSEVVTATVTDTGNTLIENATITLLRYFVDCNCYRTVQMTSTGADGTGIFYVEALDGHYKWSVAYLGTVYYLSTSSEQINSDTRTFVIDLGQNYYAGFDSLTTLGYAVTYNTTTATLSYIFTETSGVVSGGCLEVTSLIGVEYEVFDYDCVGGSSGSVFITLTNPNTTTYYYTATVNTTNTYNPLLTVDTGSIQKPAAYDFGATGIFMAVGILVVLVTLFSFSAVATIIIAVVGVIAISMLGIMTLTTSFITGIAVLILGISIFLMRS